MNASTTKLAVVPAGVSLPANPGKTPAARINYRYRQANEYGALAIMAALEVGRELLSVRDKLPYGTWGKWVEKNLEFSKDTADNFIKMFTKSVGEERAALPEPVGLETPVSADEYAAVTEKYPASSPTAFLKALVSADRSANWGGDRRAAAAANGNRVGRHPALPADGVTEGIKKAAVAQWGGISRSVGSFLSHKYELALTLPQARTAQKTVQALQDALAQRIAELEKRP